MLNSNKGALNHLLHGEPVAALNDAYRTIKNRVFGISEVLSDFESYMHSTPLGRDAEQIAKDFWDDWQDGDSPLVAAEKAITKNGAQTNIDLVNMVANWLGLMDRVDQMRNSPVLNAETPAAPAPEAPAGNVASPEAPTASADPNTSAQG